jgi:hypothetical protein
MCPPATFVVKTRNYLDSVDAEIGGVGVFCVTPTLVRGTSSYSVTLSAVKSTPDASVQGSGVNGQDDQFACSGTGLVAGWWVQGYSSSYVDGLGMSCAVGSLSLGSDNKLTITMTKQASLGVGYYTQSTPFEDDCAANEVLVGYQTRNGAWLDNVRAVCAPLQVVYK